MPHLPSIAYSRQTRQTYGDLSFAVEMNDPFYIAGAQLHRERRGRGLDNSHWFVLAGVGLMAAFMVV